MHSLGWARVQDTCWHVICLHDNASANVSTKKHACTCEVHEQY